MHKRNYFKRERGSKHAFLCVSRLWTQCDQMLQVLAALTSLP